MTCVYRLGLVKTNWIIWKSNGIDNLGNSDKLMIPKLVAHRGYMQNYPENSLLATEMALQAGACMIELDIQMSKDHQLIVSHDSNFKRTAGRSVSVFDLKQDEIAEISVHEPKKFGDQFKPTPVPLLTQVVDLLKRYPRATAFIEIKDASLDHWGLDFVMNILQQTLKPCASQCVITAFSYEALQKVKQDNFYRTGWVLTHFNERHHQQAKQLQPDYIICNYKKIPDKYLLKSTIWQDCGVWMLYDITDPELALKWAERGVELIETCDVGVMLKHPELQKSACHHEK